MTTTVTELLYSEQIQAGQLRAATGRPGMGRRRPGPRRGDAGPLRTRVVFGLLTCSTLLGSGMVVAPVLLVS